MSIIRKAAIGASITSALCALRVWRTMSVTKRLRMWTEANEILENLVNIMRSCEPDAEAAANPEAYTRLVYRLFSVALNLQDNAKCPIPTEKQAVELFHLVHLLNDMIANPELVHIEEVSERDT